MKINDFVRTNFEIVPDNLSVSKTTDILGDEKYGVVVDQNNKPISLVNPTELKLSVAKEYITQPDITSLARIKLPPYINVNVDAELSDLGLPANVEQFRRGAKGGIVFDVTQHIIGYLPVYPSVYDNRTDLSAFYSSGTGVTISLPSDSIPPGDIINTPKALPITCGVCGFTNLLPVYNRQNPPNCQNQLSPFGIHKLK